MYNYIDEVPEDIQDYADSWFEEDYLKESKEECPF